MLQAVTDFSKKTGDYPSLSSVDLSILGLTHFLEREVIGGVDHLKTEPKSNWPLINPKHGEVTVVGGVEAGAPEAAPQPASPKDDNNDEGHETEEEMDNDFLKKVDNIHIVGDNSDEDHHASTDEDEGGDDDDDDDEGGGWITAENIKQVSRRISHFVDNFLLSLPSKCSLPQSKLTHEHITGETDLSRGWSRAARG